jgi:hypothetical protein
VFYESDIWDPGTKYPDNSSPLEGCTSFRASPARSVLSDNDILDMKKSNCRNFPDPVVAKPVPLLNHHPGHPRLNRSAELDDILEEDTSCEEGEEFERHFDGDISSPSPPVTESSPSGSIRMLHIPRGTTARRSQDSQESTDSSGKKSVLKSRS